MSYIRNVGISLDRFLNALLFFGLADQTVSYHAATEQAKGKRWACILCKWLSWTVETNHCTRTLTGENTKEFASIKALIQLIIVVAIIDQIVNF